MYLLPIIFSLLSNTEMLIPVMGFPFDHVQGI